MMLGDPGRRRWMVGALVLLAGGCYLSHEPAASVGGDGGATLDASVPTDAGLDAADPACRDRAPMVTLTTAGSTYRMDVTEVTERRYARFLRCADHPVTPATCGSLSDHLPCGASGFDPDDPSELPVRCVSWCSAAAYCAWAGRRLCSETEWMAACRSTVEEVARGGRVEDPRACVLAAYADGDWSTGPEDRPVPVASAERCHGRDAPFDELRDVVGNVEEYFGECPAGACTAAGNAYTSGPYSPCLIEGGGPPTARLPLAGFRCCADAER